MKLNLKGRHAAPTLQFTEENLKVREFTSLLRDYQDRRTACFCCQNGEKGPKFHKEPTSFEFHFNN